MKILINSPIFPNIIPNIKTKQRNNTTRYTLQNLERDTVSFKAKQKPIYDLRLIPNITCACCGVNTIQSREIDSFMEKEIYFPADEAIKIIEASGVFNKKKLTDSQYEAYKFCKLLSKLYENQTLSNILDREAVREKLQTLPKDVRVNIKDIELMTKRVYHNSKYMVDAMSKFEPRMNKSEREVFQILKENAQINPEQSFKEIFNNPSVYTVNLKKIELEQGKVLWEADKLSENLSTKSKRKVHNMVKSAYNILIKEDPSIKNKRTRIIKMFEDAEKLIPEKKLYQQIKNVINQLPSSRNNASAFIIKYQDNNPNEIAKRLLIGSASTIEHVKPQKRINDPGENDIKNYIVLCSNCNSERAQIPYNEFIKLHPDMPQNAQKYFDTVIKYINNGQLQGYDKYPHQIKKAVEKESAGNIVLDYSKLNLIEASKNRKYINKNKQ